MHIDSERYILTMTIKSQAPFDIFFHVLGQLFKETLLKRCSSMISNLKPLFFPTSQLSQLHPIDRRKQQYFYSYLEFFDARIYADGGHFIFSVWSRVSYNFYYLFQSQSHPMKNSIFVNTSRFTVWMPQTSLFKESRATIMKEYTCCILK